MRGLPSWNRKQDTEDLLRARRPEAPATLLEGIARQFDSRRPARRPSFSAPIRVAALSAGLLLGLLAVGGVGFAASRIVTDFAFFGGADHNHFFGHATPQTVRVNAALAQYASAPVNTGPPTISGEPAQGSTLTASPGTWSGTPAPTFTYQFWSCDANDAHCSNVTAATTSKTYTLGASDVGRRIYVNVVATNSVGSDAARSASTAAIAASSTSVSTATTTVATTTTASGTGSATTPPNQPGTLTVTPPGSSQGATLSWTSSTFGNTAVVVTADPTPTIASGFAIKGNPGDNTVVSITVLDSNGNAIHTLAAPLEIVVDDPGVAGYVPQTSDDNGKTWRTLTACTGSPETIPADHTDCFYSSGGKFHILTLHLTLFAVISKVNATTSESGRPLAQPNSGKWGDPAFIHTGKPHSHVTKSATIVGDHGVKFGFFVDEQVAAYVQVIQHGKALPIVASKSTWRGHVIGGKTRTTVHIPVLHIGTINAQFLAPGLTRGARVKITMIDYDGNKITRTLVVH